MILRNRSQLCLDFTTRMNLSWSVASISTSFFLRVTLAPMNSRNIRKDMITFRPRAGSVLNLAASSLLKGQQALEKLDWQQLGNIHCTQSCTLSSHSKSPLLPCSSEMVRPWHGGVYQPLQKRTLHNFLGLAGRYDHLNISDYRIVIQGDMKPLGWSTGDFMAYGVLFMLGHYLFFGIACLFLSRILPPHLPITGGHFYHPLAYSLPYVATTLLSSMNRWQALLLLAFELGLEREQVVGLFYLLIGQQLLVMGLLGSFLSIGIWVECLIGICATKVYERTQAGIQAGVEQESDALRA